MRNKIMYLFVYLTMILFLGCVNEIKFRSTPLINFIPNYDEYTILNNRKYVSKEPNGINIRTCFEAYRGNFLVFDLEIENFSQKKISFNPLDCQITPYDFDDNKLSAFLPVTPKQHLMTSFKDENNNDVFIKTNQILELPSLKYTNIEATEKIAGKIYFVLPPNFRYYNTAKLTIFFENAVFEFKYDITLDTIWRS